MARVTESSLITTLAGLEQMERERAEAERWAREAELEEQRQRERRLAAEAEAAERRARWAEQDRIRAEARERDQHEARLRAMHEALVQTACIEAEARHERERVHEVHAHERKLAEIANDGRVLSLRRRLSVMVVSLAVLAALGGASAYEARNKSVRLEASEARIEALQRSLERAEGDRDRAREKQTIGETRIALLETKLNTALAPKPKEAPSPTERPTPSRVVSRERVATPKPCPPGLAGDPLNDCIP